MVIGLPVAGGGTWPEPLTMGRDRCSRRRVAVESRWRWLKQRLCARYQVARIRFARFSDK